MDNIKNYTTFPSMWILLWPGVFLVIGLFLLASKVEPLAGGIIAAVGVAWLYYRWIHLLSTMVVVYSDEVVVIKGWLKTQRIRFPLPNIESLMIEQGLLGQMLDYGRVVISGTGGTSAEVRGINHPMALKEAIDNADKA